MAKRLRALSRWVERRLGGERAPQAPARTLLRIVLAPLRIALVTIIALVLLFEEWGWQPLIRAFGVIARWRPIAAAEAALARLPPYGALAAFALPAAALFPFKLLALWLLAHEAPLTAAAVFVAAKVVGTGLVGRIFLITKPQLMRIGWFALAYGRFMPWKEALLTAVRESWAWRWGRLLKARAKHHLRRLRARLPI